jgi:hypothetical protein
VLESPVVYSAVGVADAHSGSRAYIVDFGGTRSVLRLAMAGAGRFITLVLPWMGTDFGPNAVYPVGSEVGAALSSGSSIVDLTGIETTKLLIQVAGSSLPTPAQFAGQCGISTGTFPTNVRASLNGRLPFWTNPGALAGTVQPTGLVEDLNALLSEATGPISVTLSLTTETPGVIDADYDAETAIDAERTAAARWGGQPSTEVALRALERVTLAVPFPTEGSLPWSVSGVELELSGSFPPWRAFPGQTTLDPGTLGLRVDAGSAVGRRVEPDQDAAMHGVALLIRALPAGAQLRVEVTDEKDGAPAAGPPLAATDVTVGAAAQGGSDWLQVLFAAPAQVPAGTGRWVLAKAKTGAVEWVGAAEAGSAGTRTLFAKEGGRWEPYPSVGAGVVVAQLRVLRRPFATDQAPVLFVAWEDGAAEVSVEPGRNVTHLALDRPPGSTESAIPAAGSASVTLSLKAASSGAVTIAGATARYREASS